MKRLKVLQVIPSFMVGGAEGLVLNYLRNVDVSKMDLLVISMYAPTGSVYDEEIKQKQLPVVYLKKKPGLDFSMVKALQNEIQKFSPDIIHTHMSALKYVVLTGILREKPMFHTIHSEIKKDANFLDRYFNYLAFQKGAIPIVLCEERKNSVCQYYRISTVEVLGNGIKLEDYFMTSNRRKKIREDLRIGAGDFVLGNVGRLSFPKNHLFLLEVFQKVKQKRKNAKLILVGDGDQKENILKKISELKIEKDVYLLGNRSDIPDILNTLDVFVFPSVYEGFGIALLEAQAAGLNCVVSTQVPEAACFLHNVKRLELESGVEVWAEAVFSNFEEEKRDRRKIMQSVDITEIMGKLYQLYRKYKNQKVGYKNEKV